MKGVKYEVKGLKNSKGSAENQRGGRVQNRKGSKR